MTNAEDFVAVHTNMIVVVGDRVQDFQGAWWIFQSVEFTNSFPRVVVSNPDAPDDPFRDYSPSVFPGLDIKPRPTLTLEQEIQLLSCKPRSFANQR